MSDNDNKKFGEIIGISVTDKDGKIIAELGDFKDIKEEEHGFEFIPNGTDKPYWEQLGYKTAQDMGEATHPLMRQADESYICLKCEKNKCPILTK